MILLASFSGKDIWIMKLASSYFCKGSLCSLRSVILLKVAGGVNSGSVVFGFYCSLMWPAHSFRYKMKINGKDLNWSKR